MILSENWNMNFQEIEISWQTTDNREVSQFHGYGYGSEYQIMCRFP